MDRSIIYSGQVPQTTDLLTTNKQTMIALAKLCSDLFGTATLISGLGCVPTSPASMSVNINPGQIYQLTTVDGTAYSAIAADTTHSILKQGILMDAQSFALTAPGTSGYSQNYLIQATYLDNDTNNTVLPYYNSANPSQAFNGPGGNGTSQPTTRAGQVSMQLVAGTAAATGSQTTPAVTAGYVGLAVITVANGQSTITAGNISVYPGAPILPSSLLASIQNGNLSYAVATGTANAHTIALTPALTARVDGMLIRYKAPAVNNGAVTLNDGFGTASVVGANHAALQGNEYITNGDALVMWNSSIGGGSYILLECTGGALQIAPGTQSQHAVQLGQVGHGQCRLSVASATSLVLKPYNGNNVLVNGVPLALPSAGVSVSNSGLSASTLYYVYLAGTTASPSLVLSATGHVTASSGVEVMSGDATKTLVGMIVTNSSSQFSTNSLLCANWFNRRKLLGNALTSSVTTTSTSATKLTTALDISFLCWADDIPQQFICGNIANNTNSIITNVYGYIDGSQAGLAQNYAGTANFGAPYSLSNSLGLSEGMHTSSVYGSVSSSSTGTFSANHSVITNA